MKPIALAFGVLFLLSFGQNGNAQDPSFSQFYANRIYLNPAFAGLGKGLTLTGTSRIQWIAADRGYQTFGITAEYQEPFLNSGFGLSVMRDEQGLPNLTTQQIGFTYSFIIPGENNNVHLGIKSEWTQRSIDYEDLTFSDELDPVFGVIYPTAFEGAFDQVQYFDFHFGILWRSDGKIRQGRNSLRKFRTNLGLALHHLPALFGDGPDESFQQLGTRVPPRLTIHGGVMIPTRILSGAGEEFVLSPNLKYDIQGEPLLSFQQNLQVTTLGSYFLYKGYLFGMFYQNRTPISGGKHTNALILNAGLFGPFGKYSFSKDQKWYLGASLDLNASGLGLRAGSVFELNFRYSFSGIANVFIKGPQVSSRQILDCKDFY